MIISLKLNMIWTHFKYQLIPWTEMFNLIPNNVFKGADTPPMHMPTQNDLLVAMHMVYLVLLIVELFRYVDEQSTL